MLFHPKTWASLKYSLNDCRLIRRRKIQWWCSLFLFSSGNNNLAFSPLRFPLIAKRCTGDKFEGGKFGLKIQNCLKWNLVPRLIRICRIQWWQYQKYPFWRNVVQKIQIVRTDYAGIRYLDQFNYLELNGMFTFSLFFEQKNPAEFKGHAHFLSFKGKMPFFGQVWSRKSKLLV